MMSKQESHSHRNQIGSDEFPSMQNEQSNLPPVGSVSSVRIDDHPSEANEPSKRFFRRPQPRISQTFKILAAAKKRIMKNINTQNYNEIELPPHEPTDCMDSSLHLLVDAQLQRNKEQMLTGRHFTQPLKFNKIPDFKLFEFRVSPENKSRARI